MILDTKPVEEFFKKYKGAIIVIVIIAVGVMWVANNNKDTDKKPVPEFKLPEISWYEKDKTQLDQSDLLEKEATGLADQGKYGEAIPKFKAALSALPYVPSYTSYDDFMAQNSSRPLKDQKDLLSEIQGINNRMARINYLFSFAYRDSKDLANNYQNAISVMKAGIDQFNQATTAQEIEKQIDPNDTFIGLLQDTRDKTLASYYSQLGDLYRKYEAFELSIQAHKKAIELNPESSDAFTWYGLGLIANSQYSLGCQQFNHALKLDSTNADASKFKKQFCF